MFKTISFYDPSHLQLFAIFLSNCALKSVRNDKPLTTWGTRSSAGESRAQGGGRDGRNTENVADPWRDAQIIFREIRQKRRGEVEPRPMSFRRNRLLWNCVVKARSPRFSASSRAGQRHFLAWLIVDFRYFFETWIFLHFF